MWHCWPSAPSPLSPLSPNSPVPQFVLPLLRGGQTWDCEGLGLLRSRMVHPASLEVAARVALVHACYVEAAEGDVLPAPCSVREWA